jgi:hypothetical protein
MINAGVGAAQDTNAYQLLDPAAWEAYKLDIAANAPAILANAWQLLKTKAEQNRFALFMGAAFATMLTGVTNVDNKAKFNQGQLNIPTATAATTTASSTSSSSSCNPSATADINSVSLAP